MMTIDSVTGSQVEQIAHRLPPLLQTLHLEDALTLENLEASLYEQLVQDPFPRLQRPLENRYSGRVDVAFARQIHHHNHGKGWWYSGWLVVSQLHEQDWQVVQHGITLQIDPDRHLQPQDRQAVCGDYVAVKMPRNRLEGDSYVAISNEGLIRGDSLVQLLFHCGLTGVVGIVGELTQWLNAAGVVFTLAVPQDPMDYPRRDAVRLLLRQQDYPVVRSILADNYSNLAPHLLTEVALLCKTVAPGVGLIEVMDQDGLGDRCRLMAQGILESEDLQVNGGDLQINGEAMGQILVRGGLRPMHPYLNPGNEDHYRSL
jgi:hypothetical protein